MASCLLPKECRFSKSLDNYHLQKVFLLQIFSIFCFFLQKLDSWRLKLDKHQRLNMQPNVWEKFNTNQNIQYLTLNEQQFSQLDQAIEKFRKEEALLFSALI